MDDHRIQDTATARNDPNVAALAGITHLLFFAQSIGVIVAIVLWATRGREHRALAFQCAQALVIQAGFFVVNLVYWVGFAVVWIGGTLTAAGVAAIDDGAGAWAVGIWLALFIGGIVAYLLLWVAVGGASVWLAVRCFQRREPALPGIAALATWATGYRPPSKVDSDGARAGD